MSATIQELVEAQRRGEERLNRLETIVAELAEAQRRSEERLNRLKTIVAELAKAQKRTEQRVESLALELQKTRSEVAGLAAIIGSAVRRSRQRGRGNSASQGISPVAGGY